MAAFPGRWLKCSVPVNHACLSSPGCTSENPHALTVSPFKAFSPQPPKFFKPLMPVKEEHKRRIALEARPLLSQEVSTRVLRKLDQNRAAWGAATVCINKLGAACRHVWVTQGHAGSFCVLLLLLFSFRLWLFKVFFLNIPSEKETFPRCLENSTGFFFFF